MKRIIMLILMAAQSSCFSQPRILGDIPDLAIIDHIIIYMMLSGLHIHGHSASNLHIFNKETTITAIETAIN
jgi:hypothetical protein